MSKVMVTGANGYLGRGIVTELLECGNEVVATDVNVDGIDKRATKIACDLFSVEDPYHYFGEPDILLHLAWRDGLCIIRRHIYWICLNITFFKK